MRMRASAVAAVLAAGLASCGSTSTRTTSAATRAPGTTPAGVAHPSSPGPVAAANRTFVVAVKGTSQSAPHAPAAKASLSARLRVIGSQGKLCWTFRDVVGLRNPSGAQISAAARLPSGPGYTVSVTLVPLGAHYAPAGCAPISPGIASEIATEPVGSLFLVVDSPDFPNSGLRVQF